MQVSQQDDHVTHAVIGQQESVSMGMSEDAALMHILSSTLYTYPKLASCREVICNGWDGHIIAGKLDVPLEITVSDTEFKVKDFGPGIAHAQIGPIYGTYGNSTKRDDTTQTGGFGLGSKAPFAYTDNFEVISCHDGIKTIYRVSKSSMEKGGKPSINKIVDMPTTESGITVTFALNKGDREEFLRLVHEVLLLGGIPANVNGHDLIEPLPLLESPTGYLINSVSGTLLSRINVRYGNVVYPVPKNTGFETEWLHVMGAMNKLWNNANIIFMAPPNSVSIAPSREALIFTDATVATLKALLGQFSPRDTQSCEQTVKQVVNHLVNQGIEQEDPPLTVSALRSNLYLPTGTYKGARHTSGPYAFTVRQARLNHLMGQRDTTVNGENVYFKRFHKALRQRLFPDMQMAHAMRKAIFKHCKENRRGISQTFMKAVVHRYLTKSLYDHIKSVPKLDKERLFFAENGYMWGTAKLVRPHNVVVGTPVDGLGFLYKRALLVRSKKAAIEFLCGSHRDHGNGWVVYQVTNHPERQQEVRDMFTALGYEIHESIPEPEPRFKLSDDPNYVAPERKASKKRKGYLTLAQSWNQRNKTFLLSKAREAGTEAGLKDPIAWVELENKGHHAGGKRFANLAEEECRAIGALWGDQIAVVSGLQVDAMKRRGIPSVKTFVLDHVDGVLAARSDFPRYLAFARKLDNMAYRHDDITSVLRSMLGHQGLMQELGIRFSLSAETEMLLTFFKSRDRDDELTQALPKCAALLAKVKPSDKVDEFMGKLKKSPWKDFIDLDQLHVSLATNDRNEVTHTILRHLLK